MLISGPFLDNPFDCCLWFYFNGLVMMKCVLFGYSNLTSCCQMILSCPHSVGSGPFVEGNEDLLLVFLFCGAIGG